MKLKKYTDFLVTEALDIEELKSSLKDDYIEIKKDLIDLIDASLKESKNDTYNMIDVNNFINDYISGGKESKMIDDLVEDNSIFNFYLKNQSDIDYLLNQSLYMQKPPIENDVYSLYDFVIDGTKQAILTILKYFPGATPP